MIKVLIQQQHSPKSVPTKREEFYGKLALFLIVFLLFVPILQYLPLKIDYMLAGKVKHWIVPLEDLANVGYTRYIKDLYLLSFSMLWPIMVWRLTNNGKKIIHGMMIGLGIEVAILCLGLVGHLEEAVGFLIIAGMRSLLLVHSAMGIAFLIIAYQLIQSKKLLRLLEQFLYFLVTLNFLWVTWQRGQMDWTADFALRLTGLFVNSGDFANYMIGLSMILLLLPVARSMLWRHIMFYFIFAATILSGSRAGIMIVLVVWVTYFFTNSTSLKLKVSWKMLLALLVPVLFIAILLAQNLSGRGSVVESNMEDAKGGRIAAITTTSRMIYNSPLFPVFFGKGLGYGTNTGNIMAFTRGYKHPWLRTTDNTFMTWFLQMGLVGTLALLIIIFSIAHICWRNNKQDTHKLGRLYTIFFIIFLQSFVGNILNQVALVIAIGFAIGLLLSKSESNQMRYLFNTTSNTYIRNNNN